MGVCIATVLRLSAAFRWEKMANSKPPPPRGGRRRALLTPEADRAFLQPWLERAGSGAVAVVFSLGVALARELGQPVKPSVIDWLLARHGWRKVAPDTKLLQRPAPQKQFPSNNKK